MEVRFPDDNACAKVVQALANSRLNYANSLLAGLPQSTLNNFRVSHNSAARLVGRSSRSTRISPVSRQLNWLHQKSDRRLTRSTSLLLGN